MDATFEAPGSLGIVFGNFGKHDTVRQRVLLGHLYIVMIILPRQARDKYGESTQNRTRFCRCSLRRSHPATSASSAACHLAIHI